MLSVKQRQLNLKTYYYCYKGQIDGIEGTLTKESYKTFQKLTGLSVDGIYGNNTNNKLIEVIKDIQSKLNSKGYSLVVDGMAGDNTINKIKEFQKNNGLSVDGIAGANTYSKLNTSVDPWNNISHFKKSEFTCKCGCNLNNINVSMVEVMENIRNHFNKPVIITSGTRCEKHNREVGGTTNSKHLDGKACDFVVSGVPNYEVLNYTNKLKNEGKIRYTYGRTINMGNAVHVDIN